MDRQNLILECKRRSESGAAIEAVIGFLRVSGCSKIESIAVIAEVFEIGLAKAKEAVHFSPTWSDMKAEDEKFHETIENAVSVFKANK